MITRKQPRTARIGFFAVGHAIYWNQFEGLLDSLMGYHAEVGEMIAAHEVELVDYGMVDSSQTSFETAKKMLADDLDLVFCDMVTYATSSVFVPIMQKLNIPVILIGLQPLRAMDYSKARTYIQLENDNVCSMPEFACATERIGKKLADIILGHLHGDEKAIAKVAEWCEIAKVLHALKGARIGLMGHVLEAMYDMHCDPVMIADAFGVHVPLLEPDALTVEYENAEESDIAAKTELIKSEFDMPDPGSDELAMKLTNEDLYKAARAAVALDNFIAANELTGLAYYYDGSEGGPNRKVISSLIVGNSILNAEGFPMCGEFDIKTCIAMLIMDRLNIGGSFAEFHPLDFNEDFILVGHDGPHHIAIAEGRPKLRSLKKYHGKEGSGASVEFNIKNGPFTMLGITQKYDGSFKFVIGEGESVAGPIPATGNTNTRGRFEPDTRDFITAWIKECPTHHYALGVGKHAQTIKKIADILGIESVIVKG